MGVDSQELWQSSLAGAPELGETPAELYLPDRVFLATTRLHAL